METDSTSLITDPLLLRVLALSRKTQSLALDLYTQVEAQKSSSSETDSALDNAIAISSSQKQLTAHLALLRGLNRRTITAVKKTKSATAEARSEIDALHLALRNVFYEQHHLKSEIQGCEEYDHPYQHLPLLPIHEFSALQPEVDISDEDTLMKARIAHEHSQRESLEAERQALLKRKQALTSENKKRKDDLASLDGDLEKFIDAGKAIMEKFDKEEREKAKARELEIEKERALAGEGVEDEGDGNEDKMEVEEPASRDQRD